MNVGNPASSLFLTVRCEAGVALHRLAELRVLVGAVGGLRHGALAQRGAVHAGRGQAGRVHAVPVPGRVRDGRGGVWKGRRSTEVIVIKN